MALIHSLFREYEDPWGYLSAEGMLYRAGGSALNTTATGATSFATTTPTFIVQTAAAAAAADRQVILPYYAKLAQAGATPGGGAISVLMEMDNAARYSSGGTAMTVMSTNLVNTSLPTGVSAYSTVGSAITATDAVGVRMDGEQVGPDVSTAEGAPNAYVWEASGGPDLLIPTASVGASWLINTFAGTTGPTWYWSLKFAVVPYAWCV